MKRKISVFLLCSLLLFGSVVSLTKQVEAFNATISMSLEGRDVYSKGDVLTVTITVNADYSFDIQGKIELTEGLVIVQGLSKTNNSADYKTFWQMGITAENGSWSDTFKIRVDKGGDHKIWFVTGADGTIVTTKNPAESGAEGKVAQTAENPLRFHVQTEDEEAARKASEEEAKRQSSIAESIKNSIRESEEEEDRRIREAQSREAASKAAYQASVNASIAESRSIEESIQESIYRQSMSSYWAQSEIEKSISIEESLANLTRAFEIDGAFFVPYTIEDLAELPENFLFAVSDTEVFLPEDYVQTELVINKQDVLAFQTKEMAKHLYLVYGRFSEEDEPALYFYNTKTGYFFPYELLYQEFIPETTESESESESESETVTETEVSTEVSSEIALDSTAQPSETSANRGFLSFDSNSLTIGLIGILVGACIASLIFVLARKKKKPEDEAEEALSDEAEEQLQDEAEDDIQPEEDALEAAAEGVASQSVEAAEDFDFEGIGEDEVQTAAGVGAAVQEAVEAGNAAALTEEAVDNKVVSEEAVQEAETEITLDTNLLDDKEELI